ncbi:MAG: hypothetical protein ACYS4W_02165 [Planctomycetota bacterium]|jgi:hypothetical protein
MAMSWMEKRHALEAMRCTITDSKTEVRQRFAVGRGYKLRPIRACCRVRREELAAQWIWRIDGIC